MRAVGKGFGVIVAFEPEAALVRRHMQVRRQNATPVGRLWQGMLYGHDVILLRCGMGPQRAAQAATWLMQSYRLQGAISVGFAGGLQNSLVTGDAILPRLIFAGNAHASDVSLPLTEAIEPDIRLAHIAMTAATDAALNCHRGSLLSVSEIVSHAMAKRRLGHVFGALAVDMETYSIGRIAAAHNLPFGVLRTIFDGRDEEVPLQVHRFTTPEGELQPGRLARYLLYQPYLLPETWRLWRKAHTAGSRLESWLQHFFSQLSTAYRK